MTASGDGTFATVVVRRPADWSFAVGRDLFAAYVVLVDGEKAGRLRRGDELELRVPPGRHMVRVRIDWTGSPERAIDVAVDERVVLLVKPTGSALRFDQMFGADRYLTLEQVE